MMTVARYGVRQSTMVMMMMMLMPMMMMMMVMMMITIVVRYGVRQSTTTAAKYEGTWANGLQVFLFVLIFQLIFYIQFFSFFIFQIFYLNYFHTHFCPLINHSEFSDILVTLSTGRVWLRNLCRWRHIPGIKAKSN